MLNKTLESYLQAVAMRKAYDKKTGKTNIAILKQLEDDDIPRLLEILRVLDVGYERAHFYLDASDLEETPGAVELLNAMVKVEALCEQGSKARWGAYPEPEESSSPTHQQ